MCLLSWLCMTGKGLPLLLVDDIFLARAKDGAACLTVVAGSTLLIEIEEIAAVEIIEGTKSGKYGDALHDLPAQNPALAVNHKENNRPGDKAPFRLSDGDTSFPAHALMNTAMTISHSMVSPLSIRSFIQQNFCGLLIRDEDIDIAAAQRSENRGPLLAGCRHADAAAEAAEAFKLDGNFCFPDKLTITRTAVDCKKKSRALKESQLFF